MAKILVVEDDLQFRQMLVQMLTLDGHEIATASNGLEALQLLESIKPSLIITDILMANLDGIEFILEMGKRVMATPIIAMSGGRRSISSEFNLDSAAMLGVTVSLSKPFSRADLRAAIERALRSATSPRHDA